MKWGEAHPPHLAPSNLKSWLCRINPSRPGYREARGVGVAGGGTRSGCIWWQLSQSVSSVRKQVAFGPELVKMTYGRLRFSSRSVSSPPPLLLVAGILDEASRAALRSLKRVERCAARGGWEMLGWGPTAGKILSPSTFWSKAE